MPKVAVIGGGPAGSTVATLLAQRGIDVTLFEAELFPRDHIGESLLPATLEALQLTGALAKIREAGFTQKGGATMAWGTNTDLWSWYFKETNQKHTHAYQVNREEFDAILLKHAAESGVQVRQETKVDRVLFEDQSACGLAVNGEEFRADYIVDASGQATLIGNQTASKEWDTDFQNLSIYRYYQGGSHLEGEASGNILVESCPHGWFWKIPLKNHVSSVGLVTDSENARERMKSGSLESLFQESIGQTQYISSFLSGATPIGECVVTRDWSYRMKHFVGERHCLIGDAACFIDPLFSTGVHLAIYSAVMAAALIRTVFEKPDLAAMASRTFEKSYRFQYEHFRELARLFYGSNRSVDSYFWQARQITGETHYLPREAFIRAVSGQVQHGYERSTLAHGNLPGSFAKAVSDHEKERKHRERIWQHQCTLTTRFQLSEGVEIKQSVTLGDLIYDVCDVVQRPELEDLPISPFIAQTLRYLAPDCDMQTVERRLKAESQFEDDISKVIRSAWHLLFVDGVLQVHTL